MWGWGSPAGPTLFGDPFVLEVRSDETARIYRGGGGTLYRPDRHVVVECPWIQTARRQVRRPNLFLYRHAKTANYMLALWIVRPHTGRGPGFFLELEDMDGHPDQQGVW